ncbi:ssDNA-binding domain-containing protein [Shewanella abyssi]|uniref:zincin-like metallopeptidase domain-containing protein n=1 Tax=Shewanella abyssi TaxID=311789 RepID=UPI00200D5FDB|nr:zincin-like metallopeptidase domain-containing protein [Shewanella abyssi]MCL1052218.1 ssDNA-binding domain-containing protein [Shewanella abyssi]
MENNESRSVSSLIKDKFVESQSGIKSAKQLDFYLKRDRTANDKLTKKKFKQFLSLHKLAHILKKAESDEDIDASHKSLSEVKAQLESIEVLPAKPKKNQVVLDQVLDIYKKFIESGDDYKFKKPWVDQQVLGLPRSAKSGEMYSGGNSLLLDLLQTELGLDLPFFLNQSNIEQLGLEMPEQAIAVCQKVVELFVNDALEVNNPEKWISVKKYRELDSKDQESYRKQKILKQFELYHHSQFNHSLRNNEEYQGWIENYKETKLLKKLDECHTDEERERLFEPKIYAARCLIDSGRKWMGIDLVEHPTSCHYSPSKDQIAMVAEQNFKTDHPELVYTGVYCHELSHSTGAASRLNRPLVNSLGNEARNKKNIGFEELIAESGSLMILKKLNLPSVTDSKSAAYIASWLKTQKENGSKDFLSIACHQGANAADFILTKAKEYQVQLVENLDIELFRKSCLSKGYSNVDSDTLFIADYLNKATMKAADEFLAGCFEGLNEVELLETTGRLLSSLKEQFLLTDEFNLHLKYQRGIALSDAKNAGEIVEQYSLNDIFNDIFNDSVDEGFNEHTLVNRFHELYGKSKVTEYLDKLELCGFQLKGDSETVSAIRDLTDRHYLFEVSDKLSRKRRLDQ